MSEEHWESDEFEDLVTRSLIAQYETKLHKYSRGKAFHKSFRVSNKKVWQLLRSGVYIPPDDRVISIGFIDIQNDGLPLFACWCLGLTMERCGEQMIPAAVIGDSYLEITYAERVPCLKDGWFVNQKGAYYLVTILSVTNKKGIAASKTYFVVDKHGYVYPRDRFKGEIMVAKMPESLREVLIEDMKIGETRFIEPWDMVVSKKDNTCWIKAGTKTQPRMGSMATMLITRKKGGFTAQPFWGHHVWKRTTLLKNKMYFAVLEITWWEDGTKKRRRDGYEDSE